MQIRDILRAKNMADFSTRDIYNVAADTSLLDAATYLTEKKIGLAAIFNDQDDLLGVLSERDIVRAVGKNGESALAEETSAHMTKDVKTCKSTDHPFEVIEMMSTGGFRHVPVANDGKVIGLLSSRDVFKYITDHASPEEQAQLFTKISWL